MARKYQHDDAQDSVRVEIPQSAPIKPKSAIYDYEKQTRPAAPAARQAQGGGRAMHAAQSPDYGARVSRIPPLDAPVHPRRVRRRPAVSLADEPVLTQAASSMQTRRAPPANSARRITHKEARRRKWRKRLLFFSGVSAVILTGIILSLTVLFKIETITVNGETQYETQQIIDAFGVPVGDNLFSFDLAQAQQNVGTSLPYLETVAIRRRLPDTIVIDVAPATETFVFASEYGYVVLSRNYKVLRVEQNPVENLVELTGVAPQQPSVGTAVQFTEPEKMEALNKVLAAAEQRSLAVTSVSLDNILELGFIHDGRIKIVLGTQNDLEAKMRVAWTLVTPQKEYSFSDNERGTLDVSGRNAEGRIEAVWKPGAI